MTRRKAACSFFHHFPPCNVTFVISKLPKTTAGIKALLTATWDLPVRNSTTEESASEYSLPATDLFMRANKAIRWENLPNGRFMCVFCAPENVGKCFGFIHSQPADYSGALALVCVRNFLLVCASGYISIHIYVLCHHVLGFKAFFLHNSPLL